MSKNFVFKKIPSENISITPFQVFKNWTLTESDYSSSYGAKTFQAINPFQSDTFKKDLNFNTDPNELFNPNGTYQKSHWYGLNETFYKDSVGTVGTEDYSLTKKLLFESASILSIPQNIIGERIKANSVIITDKSIRSFNGVSNTQTIELKDDGVGNLYDTAIDSGSFIPQRFLI